MTNRVKLLALVAALVLGATSAYADTITYTLTTGNSGISGTPGPYGTVLVNRTDSTHATIAFSADTGFVLMAQGIAAVNVNATTFTSAITLLVDFVGFTFPTISNGGSATEDGFGTFNFTLDASDGFPSGLIGLDFSIQNTSGTWASAANVLTPNALGNSVAAHIGVCGNAGDTAASTTCVASNGAFSTGYATNGTPTNPIPEPATLWLLGSGLSVLSGVGLRRRSRFVA